MSNTFFMSFGDQKDNFRDKSTSYKFRAPIADIECLDDLNVLAKNIDDKFAQYSNSKTRSFNDIKFNNLGKSGLRISNIGFDTSSIFNSKISLEQAEKILNEVYNSGINLFEVTDEHSELEFGKLLEKLQWKRMTFVVVKKLIWNYKSSERGLSRKFIIESVKISVQRLNVQFIDLILIEKADHLCPMEGKLIYTRILSTTFEYFLEIVRAINYLINQGLIMYWGSAKWSAVEIMEAYNNCRQFNCVTPIVEFTEYHSFCREKVEIFMPELLYKIGVGLIVWSNFSNGLQIQLNEFYESYLKISFLKNFKNYACTDNDFANYVNDESKTVSLKFHRLEIVSKQLNCTLQQLLVAWILRNDLIQCLMIGSNCLSQFFSLLDSLQVVDSLSENVMNEIEVILDNKPSPPPRISTLALR